MEGHVGEHTGEQARHIGGDAQRDGVQLGLHVGRPLHGADGGGEGLVDGADIDVGGVTGGQLGHQRLRHGDHDLHLVRAVDDGHGHGGGDKAVLHGVHSHQCTGDRGDDIALGVHVFQSGGQLLHIGLGTLHPGLQLGQGGVAGGNGALELQLRLVNLHLGGGADLKQSL